MLIDFDYMMKFQKIDDIRDTVLIPPYPNWGPTFDERLYLATDGKINDMIDEDH